MGYKEQRLGERVLEAARSGERYRDVHVFFGGTGAVGGTALLKMLDIYEEMMTIAPPPQDAVPTLVATGVKASEIEGFTTRLYRFLESRHGQENRPRHVRNGYLTHSGIYVALERFKVQPLPGLDGIRRVPPAERRDKVEEFLTSIGVSLAEPAQTIFERLREAILAARPFCSFLADLRERALKRAEGAPLRYRSVIQSIPLPSLVAYHLPSLDEIARHVEGFTPEWLAQLKSDFEVAIRDDTAEIKAVHADNLLVAHTTAVGGMYDERDGVRTARLGFAHSAVDDKLEAKLHAAESLTELYASGGIDMLITAAGIGVDEVQVKEPVTIHHQVQWMLHDLADELFPGAKELLPAEAKACKEAGRQVARDQLCRCSQPRTIPFDDGQPERLRFEQGTAIRPSAVIRSGENGYFTVANAEALYRMMRVASASELGLVLATTGLLGDDPQAPWFVDHVCYYTATDNSRAVFDFLAQPMLRRAQLNGLDPMALQDLGDSKHQGELHLLGLMILLHRLRTLDIDAIPPYVDLDGFDAAGFFVDHSKALLFEDVAGWSVEELSRDLTLLASADTVDDLEALKGFKRIGDRHLFPRRNEARKQVLEVVLHAAWNVASLGSTLVYEKEGATWLRTGYFCAPLDILVTDRTSIDAKLRELHAAHAPAMDFAEYREHLMCIRGFVDLRPHAVVSWGTEIGHATAPNALTITKDVAELEGALEAIEPYAVFYSSGILATLYRLRALYEQLGQAMVELGTLQDYRWHMPRDEFGHVLVVPGVVEAFRMAAEGLEKTTGTERLDGIWGYRPRKIADRRPGIVGLEAQ